MKANYRLVTFKHVVWFGLGGVERGEVERGEVEWCGVVWCGVVWYGLGWVGVGWGEVERVSWRGVR